ncbi:MAG: CHAT domain-containing protein, partial [Saprospiraceae bacterium]
LADALDDRKKESLDSLQRRLSDLYNLKFERGVDMNPINAEIFQIKETIDLFFANFKKNSLQEFKGPANYIEYSMLKNDIFVIGEINGSRFFVKLDSTGLFQKLSDRLNEHISLKGLSKDDIVLAELYRLLIEPLPSPLPPSFVIIPDGMINFVPFEILKDRTGEYLIENATISYAPKYLMKTDLPQTENAIDIFCLLPQYKIKENLKKEISRGSFYHLPYARMEVDSIRSIFSKSTLTSKVTDKQDFERQVRSARIFHYAGHAIIRADKAYLALSDEETDNAQLTDEEIALLRDPVDLVVLSACETGLGKLEQGEGIRSLGRSFMEAGARATIISLWNVNDQSTAIIMTDFYKNLKAGMRKDDALRLSKLKYLKNASSMLSHPYYWAAFIPAGDMVPIATEE